MYELSSCSQVKAKRIGFGSFPSIVLLHYDQFTYSSHLALREWIKNNVMFAVVWADASTDSDFKRVRWRKEKLQYHYESLVQYAHST